MSASASSSSVNSSKGGHNNRNLLLVIIGVIVIAGVIGGGYGLWYILVGPSSPSSVNAGPPAIPSGAAIVAPASFDGTWNADTSFGTVDDGTASFAGYRVQEQLVGIGGHQAVGRTPKLTGTMTLTGSVVSGVEITADLSALKSDQDARDSQLHRQAIETDTFPTASFKMTSPIDLGSFPADSSTVSVNATGTLTLHGVTKTVTIAMQGLRHGGVIAITGSLPIVFGDYSIQKPTSFSVLSVDDHGIMEFHLLFTHA